MRPRAADVLLADGTTVHLRPIDATDADAVVAMHGRFSEQTRYFRYFSPYPRIPARDLDRFVNVDHVDREALVIAAGPDLIGVGRYERLGPDAPDAEVAFVVEDAYQGRGVGSVLLEHLAAAAREVGIERFVAEVLPANGAMLRVFTDAGYEVSRQYADGVVHLTFPVAQTQRSLAVQWDREHRTEARSVARLMRPEGVAVYGASSSGRGVGAAALAHLRAGGFTGPIHAGRHLTEQADLAVVAVPPEAIGEVVADAAAAGVHGLLVITELDPSQRRDLVEATRAAGMRLVGPGSLGLADHTVHLNATLVPRLPAPGRVALFSQSGTLGLHLMAEADRRGLGMSSFASVGRRADVSGNDLLQFWADDPQTDIIAMYLESFGNPRKFARIARTVGRRKPIIVLASETGAGGSSTLDSAALEALRAHSGVIEVGTVSELLDVASVLDSQPLPVGDRIAVVSNAFAMTALAAARVRSAGLQVGRSGSVSTSAPPAELAAAVRSAVESDDADAVVVVVTPPLPTGPLSASETELLLPYMQVLAEVVQAADKPVVVTSLPGEAGPAGVPSFRSIEEAVRALAHAVRRAAWLREPPGTLPTPLRPTVSSIAEALEAYDIPVLTSYLADSVDAAQARAEEAGYPVALKAAEHPQRIDLGAVRLNLGSAPLVRGAYTDLAAAFGPTVVVQKMAPPGVACVIEVRDDPAFGPVVGFGLGGPIPELVGDRAWRAAPLTDRDAQALLRTPKAAPLLAGVDLAALAELLVRIGQLADEVPGLRNIVLNPVLAHEKGWTALHAAGVLDTPADRPDSGPRRL
ncbi:GNAT family N-acetyltransferase [Rhizocola hellebori]|uniref:GNAT family N-acetyltransferase n=2 Tax=Rhizocola hellebori TaxID=1392758 RepID=A0A8J3QD05_9ACTN|nr:GNAT family N-acetyltransferase [Rhizocola hellebori]